MNIFKFSINSARYFWKDHLGTFLGTIVGTGVLTGALLVGDSVKGSLLKQALNRVGNISKVLVSGDRFFSESLITKINRSHSNQTIIPSLLTRGVASINDKSSRANQVQIIGITESFWDLDPSKTKPQIEPNEVWINKRLAHQLNAEKGDEILFRFEKPSLLTRESALAPQEDYNVVARLTVGGVLPQQSLGAFSLYSGQVAPLSAFLRLEDLQVALEIKGSINMALTEGVESTGMDVLQSVKSHWSSDDVSLDIKHIPHGDSHNGVIQISTPRVFIDPTIEQYYRSQSGAHGVLTYFVNSITKGVKSTPYSMITGSSNPELIGDCSSGEIVLNQWLASDLDAKVGDEISIEYYVMGQADRLETRNRKFRVNSIVPLSGLHSDRTLMPEFPGVAEADTTRDWDAGFPLDLGRIRDKDEDYWKEYKGTPKAFISLDDAQELWGNRYGNLTAIRILQNQQGSPTSASISDDLLGRLNPADVGFSVLPLKKDAFKAATESFSFSSLFVSFSFFIILSAMILVLLFFQFGVEKRLSEMGVLSALGYTVKKIRIFYLTEGFILAVMGCFIGVFSGKAYAKAMIFGLTNAWKDAISATPLFYFEEPATLFTGWLSGILVALLAIALSFWKYSKLPSVSLISIAGSSPSVSEFSGISRSWTKHLWVLFFFGAVGLLIPGFKSDGPAAAGMFFGAGSFLLLSLHVLLNKWLNYLGRQSGGSISRFTMSVRNIGRKPKRTMAVVASLACGGFLVTAISPFQMDASVGADKRQSGTGGYALYGVSIVPIVQDLKSDDGLDFFGFDQDEVETIEWVPLRVRDGDDASCLNLNKAQQPKVIGVDPSKLADVDAFTFAGKPWKPMVEKNVSGWNVLNQNLEDDSIPAIVDAATLAWALKMKLGDYIEYPGPSGEKIKLRFVATLQGSMLQGVLIIADKAFQNTFPYETGFREFLINSPKPEETSKLLTRAMEDFGMEITPSVDVLNRFNAVQNTYIKTFQLLGQLGVILGSLAIAVIAMRNVFERSGELGLLETIGFQRATLRWQIGLEHWVLLWLGLVFGLISATLAVLPVILSGSGQISLLPVFTSLSWILASGSIWVLVALSAAFRGHFKNSIKEL